MDDILQSWLDGYRRAWETNDPEDIRGLFTEDATYSGHPFDTEPWQGREGIVEGWLSHRDEPGTWSFEGAPLTFSNDIGIVQGLTRYSDGRTYANLWVIGFAPDGRAQSFAEWYMTPEGAGSGPE